MLLQGYYDTMDAGYLDEFGYIYVTARDDDIINVAGHRISTAALEDIILAHADVVDAAVVGVPDHTKGEVPLCLYVRREGTLIMHSEGILKEAFIIFNECRRPTNFSLYNINFNV